MQAFVTWLPNWSTQWRRIKFQLCTSHWRLFIHPLNLTFGRFRWWLAQMNKLCRRSPSLTWSNTLDVGDFIKARLTLQKGKRRFNSSFWFTFLFSLSSAYLFLVHSQPIINSSRWPDLFTGASPQLPWSPWLAYWQRNPFKLQPKMSIKSSPNPRFVKSVTCTWTKWRLVFARLVSASPREMLSVSSARCTTSSSLRLKPAAKIVSGEQQVDECEKLTKVPLMSRSSRWKCLPQIDFGRNTNPCVSRSFFYCKANSVATALCTGSDVISTMDAITSCVGLRNSDDEADGVIEASTCGRSSECDCDTMYLCSRGCRYASSNSTCTATCR